MIRILFFFINFILCNSYEINIPVTKSVNNLKISLFTDYNRDVIPIKDEPIELKLGFILNSIDEINHIDGYVTYNGWLKYEWNDYQLSWNLSKYNIKQLTFNTNPLYETSIWTPNIYILNSIKTNFNYLRANINYDGNIIWYRQGTIKSLCNFNLKHYPFDNQNCQIKFGIWNNYENELQILENNEFLDLSNFYENDEWEMKSYNSINNLSNITLNFNFKRYSKFYQIHIILPIFLISILLLLTLIIPISSGERISFTITILLSIIVFLLLISDNIPKTNEIPLLSIIVSVLTITSFLGVFFTTVISSIETYREKEIYEKGKDSIENIFIKYIYKIYKKINSKKLKRTDSYINGLTNSVILNKELNEIINNLTKIYNVFFTFIFTIIVLYIIISIN